MGVGDYFSEFVYGEDSSNFNSLEFDRPNGYPMKDHGSKYPYDKDLYKDEQKRSSRSREPSEQMKWVTLLLWFIILTIVWWIILYAWKPTAVQTRDSKGNPTGDPDGAKVLVASLLLSLIITILLFVIFTCSYYD